MSFARMARRSRIVFECSGFLPHVFELGVLAFIAACSWLTAAHLQAKIPHQSLSKPYSIPGAVYLFILQTAKNIVHLIQLVCSQNTHERSANGLLSFLLNTPDICSSNFTRNDRALLVASQAYTLKSWVIPGTWYLLRGTIVNRTKYCFYVYTIGPVNYGP